MPSRTPRRAGIVDVAARAGVSTATVSLVLRGRPWPSAATGAAVRVIREAGVPGPGPDQYMAPQLAAAEQALRDGSVLAAVAEALAGVSVDAEPQDLAEESEGAEAEGADEAEEKPAEKAPAKKKSTAKKAPAEQADDAEAAEQA